MERINQFLIHMMPGCGRRILISQ